MKILHINTYNTGGAAISCLRTHKALLENGINSKVLLRNKTNTKTEEVYEIWEELNVIQKTNKFIQQKQWNKKQSAVKEKCSEIGELFSVFDSIWEVSNTQLFKEADIINLHWIAGFVNPATFFKSIGNKPVVWTLHDFAPFNNGLHYPNENTSIFTEEINHNKALIYPNLFENTTIVGPSQYIINHSQKSEWFSKLNHQKITNCCNTKQYKYLVKSDARKELGFQKEQKIILFVAEQLNYKRKGYKLLTEAVKLLNEINLQIIVVGNDYEEDNTFSDSITHFPHIDSEAQLNKIYAAADVFIAPSLDDNLPNTVMESLCSGTPVVAFNIGGMPEMINSEKNGILVETTSAAALSKAITKSLKFKWNNEAIALAAKLTFSESNCANAYINVYKALLNDC